MTRKLSKLSIVCGVLSISFLAALGSVGCTPGGVGDPCTPEDEYLKTFSGFSVQEVNVESKSFQCETRICLVNHFQGRVKCPYGNATSTTNVDKSETPPHCVIPGSQDEVTAPVDPQLLDRRADDAVYCSCRCDGPDKSARYCECPSGFGCVKLVDDLGLGTRGQLAGSYCVREGTEYDKTRVNTNNTCRYSKGCAMGAPDNCQGVTPKAPEDCGPVTVNGEPP